MPELEAARTASDPREKTFRTESGRDGPRMFLRRMPSVGLVRGSVLYLHGATFTSALSIAYRSAGRSCRDALCEASDRLCRAQQHRLWADRFFDACVLGAVSQGACRRSASSAQR